MASILDPISAASDAIFGPPGPGDPHLIMDAAADAGGAHVVSGPAAYADAPQLVWEPEAGG